MHRGIKAFILIPVFTMIWGVANSIGVTSYVSEETGLPDLNKWEIPGLAELVDFREFTGGVANEAKGKARRAAIKAVKSEVRRRYGPEAAKLIPNDMSLKQAKNFDYKQFEDRLPDGIPTKPAKPGKPKPSDPQPTKQPTKAPDTTPGGKAVYAKALKTLGTLDVKGKSAMTGYDRDRFHTTTGDWDDTVGNWFSTGNGCDTREDILKRDLVNVKYESGSKCDIVSGTLPYEPYTGQKNYRFDSEDDEYSTDLDTEHIVALGNVWVTGGSQWTEEKRARVSNDPANLLMADPSSNRQKGDADFATWLPSNKSYRCTYAVKQINVKSRYDLWVTSAEKDAMVRVLNGCA